MNKTLTWVIVVIVVVLGIYLITDNNQAPVTGEPIKLGFVGPLTGDASTLGESARAAVSLAIEEINAEGGINGNPVEVIYEDGRCTGNYAVDAVNKLINIDNVHGIIGGLCSAETSAFAPIAEEAGVPTISYCSSAPALSDAGDYIFRVYPSDSFQGIKAANYLKEEMDFDQVAILYTNDDWGTGLKGTFSQEFEKLGGTISTIESFEKSSRDLRTQLTKIKSSNAQAIYWAGFADASIPGIGQYREFGLDIPVLGADAWDDPSLWESVGSSGEGFMFISVRTPENEEFRQKLLSKTDQVTICAPQSYDSVQVFKEAIESAGTDRENIKDALYNIDGYQGVSGVISFNEKGDLLSAEYDIKMFTNGDIEVVN
ncbi:MAG: ABC transporter substrate-binding protein [Candidatus Paceibacterota bacterium]